MKNKIKCTLLFTLLLVFTNSQAQEMGSNFNHNAEIIDFDYLKQAKVEWVRATPRILDYADGKLTIENDPATLKIIASGEQGYKVIYGFRWDFKHHKMRIPTPNSPEEKRLFDVEKRILEQLGAHITIFSLGNEPNLETLDEDMKPDANGSIPLIVFMKRQLEEVVLPYFKAHPERPLPPMYLGSLPALFEKKQQDIPANIALLKMTEEDPRIAGFDLHLHIVDFKQAEDALRSARKIVKKKPFIVTEFSLHRLFLAHRSDLLGDTEGGKKFCETYQRDPKMAFFAWCGIANTEGVSVDEWTALFASRTWFPPHYLRQYYALFQKYGVTIGTFPLFQQSAPKNMTANSPMWFINPIFSQISLKKQADGSISKNPICFDDFVELVEKGKKK